jgi:hypothetical protein
MKQDQDQSQIIIDKITLEDGNSEVTEVEE